MSGFCDKDWRNVCSVKIVWDDGAKDGKNVDSNVWAEGTKAGKNVDII